MLYGKLNIMKKHAIIPIFIPHAGCENDCVFCNQRRITARQHVPNNEEIKAIIDKHLSTLENRGLKSIEVAFFGGSFTGLPVEQQNSCISVAKNYLDIGRVNGIRISTRPDYIDDDILNRLKYGGVNTIELGIQSFDNNVLSSSNRGHSMQQSIDACKLVKAGGFNLGIQLMIGLPEDTKEKSISSSRTAASLFPKMARLYPTLILPDTRLEYMFRSGAFVPMSSDTLRETTMEMYRILTRAGITMLRVGLKSTDLILPEADLSGGYHPAFRQLVEGDIALSQMKAQLTSLLNKIPYISIIPPDRNISVECRSNSSWFSNMIGHKACNKKALSSLYPQISISYKVDNNMSPGTVEVTDKTVLK